MCKILTVVIPTYNMENYLRRCLDSLIIKNEEIFKTLEILVVNDGSKDSSSAIAHEYQDNYPNVFRVIDKENGNYGSCVNRGLIEATGKYFRILDADDWFITEGLSEYICRLKDISTDVVITNYSQCFSTGKRIKRVAGQVDYGKIYNLDEYDIIKHQHTKVIAMHGLTVLTSMLREKGYFQQEGISYTDIEFVFFSLIDSHTITFLNVELYQYFIGRDGQTISKEQEIKHYNDFYKVGIRLIKELVRRTNEISVSKRDLLARLILTTVAYDILAFPLAILKNPTIEMNSNLTEFDGYICRNASLYKFASRLTFKKLKFYYIWKKSGFRIARIIGKTAND